MCKKLMFLISFVVVLGLVSSASAITWNNAAPGDDQWNTPGNWVGGVVPGGGDVAIIDAPPSRGPVIGSDVTVGEIGGLRLTSNDDQVMDISSGNVQIGWWWGLAEAGTGTATLNMVGDANIAVGGIEAGYDGTTVINIGGTTVVDSAVEWRICNEDSATVYLNITDQANIHVGPEKNAWRFADKGTMVTTISGNPTIVIEGKWRNGDETGHSVVNMSGGSLYTDRYMSCYDDGMATFSFSGGTVDVDGLSYAGGGGDLAENPYTLNISGSASVTARQEIRLGYQADPLNVTQASVTLNQTGGTLQTPGPFNAFGAKCPVNMSLTGGQLRCGSFQDQPDVRPYSLYICGGELVVQGDVTAQMQADIDAGYITGCHYGSPPVVEFDSGETTVSSPGDDFVWTGDYPWSMLWISPWNWDPIGIPSDCDDTAIIEASGGTIVLDTAMTVGRIRGPGVGADADQDMYLVKDCDLYVCDNWEYEETVPFTGTIWGMDAAKVEINQDFRSHGEHARCIMNLSDNAEFVIGGDLRAGDEDDDYFELNMTDNSFLSCTDRDDGFRQNDGEIHVNLSGNAYLTSENARWRGRADVGTSNLSIVDSAQYIITDGHWQVFGGHQIYTIDILDDGVLDVEDGEIRLGEDNDFSETITLNMSGQLIHSAEHFIFPYNDEAAGFTTINLDSGVIDTEGEIRPQTDNWIVNICGDGVWIVDGDRVAQTLAEADDGHWMACPEEDCRGEVVSHGTLMVDYDNVNSGRTTIWSELNLALPWSPLPVDGATDVPCQGTSLCWCLPDIEGGVKDQFVFLSTDCEAVENRNPAAFLGQAGTDECVELPCLALSTTYCWAVDTLDHFGNVVRGPVWSFTVTHCTMIEDFESYVREPWNLIWKSWFDGCGYWVGDQLVGNGTGSCVSLEMSNTHDGAKAMVYTYENDYVALWERDHNYSEACRTFDPALDLDCCDDKALVIYFYGDADNDVTDMWVKVNGVKSTYGDGDLWWENPADIQTAEWLDWNTEMSEFADGGADLSEVTEICIGFGDDENNVPDFAYGMMLFDCIQTCEPRCVLRARPYCFGDHTDDCIVDWRDVKVIADNWLEDLR